MFSSTQLNEAIEFISSGAFSDLEEDEMLMEMMKYIARNIYSSQTSTEPDETIVMNLGLHIIESVVFNKIGTLELSGYQIPLPSPNIGQCSIYIIPNHRIVPRIKVGWF